MRYVNFFLGFKTLLIMPSGLWVWKALSLHCFGLPPNSEEFYSQGVVLAVLLCKHETCHFGMWLLSPSCLTVEQHFLHLCKEAPQTTEGEPVLCSFFMPL